MSTDTYNLLRRARLKSGLTQQQLAERVGVTQQQIAKLESPGANPTLGGLVRVFGALGLQVHVNVRRKS